MPGECCLKSSRSQTRIQKQLMSNKRIITSYVVNTQSAGKRNMFVLFTMPSLLGVTRTDRKKKLAIIKLYDFTNGWHGHNRSENVSI